jgi:hypothetical protein
MMHSFWDTGDHPILIDPTPDEYQYISDQRWDSLRIMVGDGHIGIASGYGCTHTTVEKAMRLRLGIRCPVNRRSVKTVINATDLL